MTTISVGNGATDKFWESTWLQGESPKRIAPAIYKLSKKKKRSVQNALVNDNWIRDIDVLRITSAAQLADFTQLWLKLGDVQLDPDRPDSIVWNATKHGEYTTASAYAAQFKGLQISPMERLIWRVWAPPKCKFFSWLAFQDGLWTSDRLIKRDWPNQKICFLCHGHDESNLHIFTQCRYSLAVWDMTLSWVAAHVPSRTDWSAFTSTDEWWTAVGSMHGAPQKGWRSLMILVVGKYGRNAMLEFFDGNSYPLDNSFARSRRNRVPGL
jgi:hypothetical protein